MAAVFQRDGRIQFRHHPALESIGAALGIHFARGVRAAQAIEKSLAIDVHAPILAAFSFPQNA